MYIIGFCICIVLFTLLSALLKVGTHGHANQQTVVIPDLSEWDHFTQNLGDDSINPDPSAGDCDNFLLAFPGDVEDPDETMVVKAIRVFHMSETVPGPVQFAGTPAAGLDSIASSYGFWAIGFFDFDETDETTEADRDERKEAIWVQPFGYTSPVVDNAANHGQIGDAYGLDTMIEFEKPQEFPLNPSMKFFVNDGAGTGVLIDMTEWYCQIWYKVKKRKTNIFGRLLALMRMNVSL